VLRGHLGSAGAGVALVSVGLSSRRPHDRFSGGLLLAAASCGANAHHYTKSATDECLSRLGALAEPAQYGGVLSGSAVALRGENEGKVIEIEFLPTAEAARERLAKGWPPGKVKTKGNAIVWVHQTYPGKAEPSDDDLKAAEQCLR
jgi:hypothetical protein